MSSLPGLCGTCQHVKRTVTKRDSVFYLCRRAQTDPTFRKYPPLPVLRCRGYEAHEESPERDNTAAASREGKHRP